MSAIINNMDIMRQEGMSHRKSYAGFTLMELLITLAILAILIAIAVPSMSGVLERRKVHGAGENLFANLMFSKTEAIKRNQPVGVTFKITNANTWCYGIATAACDCTNTTSCTIDGVLKVTNQGDFPGVTIDTTDSTIVTDDFVSFESLRGATNLASGTEKNLQFNVPSGAEYGVIISSFGRVRLCGESFNQDACP